jgi:hypothetical protein
MDKENRVIIVRFANLWLVTDLTRYATAETREEALDIAMIACLANGVDTYYEGERTDCEWVEGVGVKPIEATLH